MPAITRVAAWMRALTGVGPSIASGSQTWKGNWADLPATPMKMSAAERLRLVGPISPASARAKISCMGEGAGGLEEDENADEEGHVAHAGHDKRLLGGLGGGAALGVEADQEVGAEADQLPEDVEDEQVVDDDEGEHRRGEEGEHGEEPAELGVAAHVGEGVDLHRQRDRPSPARS